MKVEALEVDIHHVLGHVTVFWQKCRHRGYRTGGSRQWMGDGLSHRNRVRESLRVQEHGIVKVAIITWQ